MSGKLKNKVAIITGAGSGIGAATARLMAAEGASVAVTGVPEDGVISVAAEITTTGGSAIAIPTDVTDPQQVESAVAHTVSHLSGNSISWWPTQEYRCTMKIEYCISFLKMFGIVRMTLTTRGSIFPVNMASPRW